MPFFRFTEEEIMRYTKTALIRFPYLISEVPHIEIFILHTYRINYNYLGFRKYKCKENNMAFVLRKTMNSENTSELRKKLEANLPTSIDPSYWK